MLFPDWTLHGRISLVTPYRRTTCLLLILRTALESVVPCACLTAMLFACGCATSRHVVTRTCRPAVVTDSNTSGDLPATPAVDDHTALDDSVFELPKNAYCSDDLHDQESNVVVPVGFAVR